MSPAVLAGIALAGALGAVSRFLLDAAVASRMARLAGHVWGIAVVNVLGSLGAGVVAGAASRALLGAELQFVVATGFLGAFTTFSTWMVQAMTLFEEGQRRLALLALCPLLAGVLAAFLGLALTA